MLWQFPVRVLLAILTTPSWLRAQAAGWLKQQTPPWQPHTGSISVSLSDGSVLLMAGQAGEHGGALFDCFNCTKEVWKYQPIEDIWTDLSKGVPWDPRWGHSAAVDRDDTVWLMWGCCEKNKPTVMLTDIWTYNPIKGTPWTKVDSSTPWSADFGGVQASSIQFSGSDLWVVGGWSQWRGTMSQVAVLHTDSLKWTVKSQHGQVKWKHRADHATAISPSGEWLFVLAGQHRDEKTGQWFRMRDTWRVELPGAATNSWQEIGGLQPQNYLSGARSSPAVLTVRTGWLLILGGHVTPDMEDMEGVKQEDVPGMIDHHGKTTFQTYNDIQALDLVNGGKNGWQVVEVDAPWPSRDDCAGVTAKDDLLIFGGGTLYGGGGYLQDVWRLPDASQHYKLKQTQVPVDEL